MTLGLILGLIVWLVCGVLTGVVADAKNRDAAGWAFAGFLTGIFGLVATAGMPPLAEQPALAQEPESRMPLRAAPPAWAQMLFGILCAAIVLIGLLAAFSSL